ncbi:hypothetical protein LEN26_015843 [Aphanomyces euteiches]|nr:hypothetical protein LEN26_015843 [Aphanomyces euteiches]KAH9112167.1 hypothetical protein AeMF1_013461 [Aphanomyces euteiches]KAH9183111.1 hypothetical protein AeNC1_014915 [Aphanomyces euteiches]
MAWTWSKCYMLIMIIANVIFLAAGIFVLYLGAYLKKEHWTDMFEGDELGSIEVVNGKVSIATVIFSCAMIVSALIGLFGAVFRLRSFLIIYSIISTITAIFFLVLSIVGFVVLAKVNSWKDDDFPADDKQEPKFATQFNKVYCYATGANICNNVAFDKALKTLSPDSPTDLISQVLDVLSGVLTSAGITGMQTLCENYMSGGPVADLLQLVPSFKLDPVCKGCELAGQFSRLNSVFAWANHECPPDPASLKWCVSFLAKKTVGEPYNGAPFGICRAKLYGALSKWSPVIAGPALAVSFLLFFLVFVACVAHRRDPKPSSDTAVEKEAATVKSGGQFVPINSKKVNIEPVKTPVVSPRQLA